ncbi:MAG: Holliday junction branch migration DNA helicase RuvB [Erysipelotrichaceae bacterium]|nr:Holliday junction branch migration DNA helicase RuvB [Erysipelotrichaceae bacterium]
MNNRVLNSSKENYEEEEELKLRPSTLCEYIGQEDIKRNLSIFINASNQREEALDHVLIYGPPGLGKTTLSHVIAKEKNANIRVASGPAIEKTGDLASILSMLEPGDVLFIDEIHRLPKVVEEVLYSAMEDFVISIVVGKDSSAHTIQIDLPPFTLIGATTRVGDVSAPLRDRFGIVFKLDYYGLEDIKKIVLRTAKVYGNEIELDAANELARRSRGTPRIANRLFRRVRDFATVTNSGKIDLNVTSHALNALKVDELGLDDVDIRYLKGIIERFKGGPVGIESIAAAIGEEEVTLEDVYEPYLLQQGLINRTPRGRIATEKAYKHLHIPYQTTLF